MDQLSIKKLGEALLGTGLVCYDRRSSTFTYLNKAFLSIVERNADELMHHPSSLLELFTPKDLNFLDKSFATFLKKGQFHNIEFSLAFPDGHHKNILCDSIEMEEGNTLVTFVRDITRRKSQEEYLIKHSAQKDTLLDMLTHSLSGPLFISKDILSMLNKDMNEDSAEARRLVSLLLENTQQCIDIVNDFLKKEHFESTRIVVNSISFDVVEKINVVLDKLRELNTHKTFILSCSQSSLIVFSDPVKFFQIIQNLLSNAVKFTKHNGVIEVMLENNASHFIILIKDNGIGVSSDLHPEIFKERVEGRRGLAGEPSNGIGLFVTQRLVEMLGGSISLLSAPVEGSSFRVELPLNLTGL